MIRIFCGSNSDIFDQYFNFLVIIAWICGNGNMKRHAHTKQTLTNIKSAEPFNVAKNRIARRFFPLMLRTKSRGHK